MLLGKFALQDPLADLSEGGEFVRGKKGITVQGHSAIIAPCCEIPNGVPFQNGPIRPPSG